MQKFRTALFDVDGTILDTSEFIFQAYEYTLNKFGLAPKGRREIAQYIGIPLETIYETLSPGEDTKALSQTHRDFQLEHLYLSKPFPGTLSTLAQLKEAEIKIGVVTTRSHVTAIETLDLALISDYIDYVVGLEDVAHLKPDPEPVLKALHYLNTEPHDAVMVGDSDVDVIAGRTAGTTTIGATYGFHGLRLAKSNPDYLIDSIEEVIPIIAPQLKDVGELPIIK
ncbi:MAG TPA: HAD-IA family hydrolase [Candidatus Aquicultor sp.]|jgi:pyrophosphatase PpaX